jgi:hypothetical protein
MMIALLLLVAQSEPSVFRAGFAEVEITPPMGTPKQGSNGKTVASSVRDPLYARAAVFERDGERAAIVQLDTALILAGETAAIRKKAQEQGFPGDRILVSATHNHAGPALIDEGLPRDPKVVEMIVSRAAEAVVKAAASLREAEIGVGTAFEFDVAFNRRILMRDGTARTHGSFRDPNALAFEAPIDPEVAVVAVRGKDKALLGALVNFACHPAHHWNDGVITAGFPGEMAKHLKSKGVAVPMFLQGAAGNMHHQDPRGQPEKSMEEIGRRLADAASRALEKATWSTPASVAAVSRTLKIPYRKITEHEILGTAPGAQRFGEKGYYDRKIPELVALIEREKTADAEVQVIRLGDLAFASQPAESFAELGLDLKRRAWPVRTLVLGFSNGMLGYLPHRDCFKRGGYECTFGPPSCMDPEAGHLLVDAAVDLIRGK